MDIHQIIYTKRLNSQSALLNFVQIVKNHQTLNNEAGISGFLIFHQNCFIHLIEGERTALMPLLKVAQDNPNCTDFKIVLENQCADRQLLTWGVGSAFSELPLDIGFHLSLDDTKQLCATIEGEVGQTLMEFLDNKRDYVLPEWLP